MAIFNTIKNTVKSVVSKASDVVNKIGNKITGAIGLGTSSSNTASALYGQGIPSNAPYGSDAYYYTNPQKVAMQGSNNPGSIETGGSLPPSYSQFSNSYPKSSQASTTSTPLPVTINAGVQRTGSSSNGSGTSANFASNISPLQSTTISSKALGASSGTGTTSGTAPLVLSSAPVSSNPNKIDNTKLAGELAGIKKYNPTTGQLEDQTVVEDPNKKIAEDQKALFESILGTKQSVYEDKAVKEATNLRNQIRESLLAPTNELNAIIAKQNQDLIQLRQTGSKEGVTEAVYGGQTNAINYNAAIRALPLQASISAIKGNLELATEYLTELTKTKSDQINNQYEYNKNLLNSISSAIDKKDQRIYEEMKSKNESDKRTALDLENFKETILTKILENNPNTPTTVINRIANATNIADVVNSASKYVAKSTVTGGGVLNSLPTSIQGKLIGIAQDFGQKPSIKKYIEAVDSNNIISNIDPKSKNPADHQQIVYAFAKALDPDSAVKEGEYNTIKKYAQSAIDRYGKEISNALNGTGFLSETAIKNIQTTVTNTLNSRKSVYENTLNGTKNTINNIAGKDVANEIMIDYSGGISNQNKQLNAPVTPEIQSLRSKYNY